MKSLHKDDLCHNVIKRNSRLFSFHSQLYAYYSAAACYQSSYETLNDILLQLCPLFTIAELLIQLYVSFIHNGLNGLKENVE